MAEARHKLLLDDWSRQLREKRDRRLRLRRWVPRLAVLCAALGLTIVIPPRPLLVWNVSASAPVGLYGIGGRGEITVGDMVLAHVPASSRHLAALRHYIPANVPLVKRVAAEPGDEVCAHGADIFVNGSLIASRHKVDARGRPMPWWRGCVRLRRGALFLLMEDPASFDGRYFGPTERGDVIGTASLLWER